MTLKTKRIPNVFRSFEMHELTIMYTLYGSEEVATTVTASIGNIGVVLQYAYDVPEKIVNDAITEVLDTGFVEFTDNGLDYTITKEIKNGKRDQNKMSALPN